MSSLEETPYYHCMSRCVRRAFLCGDDQLSGNNYDHRKRWIVARLKQLASVFCIDICAYAVRSNHYHVVLRVDKAGADNLSDKAVAERWCSLFNGHYLVHRWLSGECDTEAEEREALLIVAQWRERLTDIGWFVGRVNESVSRQAKFSVQRTCFNFKLKAKASHNRFSELSKLSKKQSQQSQIQ